MRILVLVLVAVSLAAFWLGNRSTPSDTSPLTQTESSGEVTVTATLTRDQIEMILDTHSVDLSGFDFKSQVTPGPDEVTITADSQHHRRANLKYRRLNLPFTLVISDLAQIPQRRLVFGRR